MRLSKLILLNWGAIPNSTYSFDGTTCLAGETGAGKTSILDAMIAVMTGGSSRLGKLNSASDDGKGVRHRDAIYRTIQSYVLGGNNALFARASAHAYAALIWEPEESEVSFARPVTAILAASAVKKQSTLGGGQKRTVAELGEMFLIAIPGATVSFEDFTLRQEPNLIEPVPVEEIGKHLKERYQTRKGDIKVHVLRKDQHAEYLKRLFGALEGREEVSLERANSQAEIWSKFVSQEYIDNINDFVRRYVLPAPKDFNDLEKITAGVRASRKLKEQVRLVGERIACLDRAKIAGESFSRKAIGAKAIECAVARRGYDEANEASKRAGLQVKELEKKKAEANERTTTLDTQLKERRAELTAVEARLMGVTGYVQAKDLKAQIGAAEAAMNSHAHALQEAARDLARLASLGQIIPEAMEKIVSHKSLVDLIAKAFKIGLPEASVLGEVAQRAKGIDATSSEESLNGLATFAQPIEERVGSLANLLCGEDRALGNAASASVALLTDRRAKLETEIADKRDDISQIQHKNTIRYPRLTQETLEYLKGALPNQAAPMVLCDLVNEVRAEAWQPAIEGYLGNARFHILVKPEFEPQADELLEARRRSGRPATSLIQGKLAYDDARNRRTPLPADSIVHELVIENPYAKAYLEQKFGQVVKVSAARGLSGARAGVTIGGRGAGGYDTFDALVDEGDLSFGKRARERRLERRRAEVSQLEGQLQRLDAEVAEVAQLQRLDEALSKVGTVSVTGAAAEVLACRAERRELERRLKLIDVTDAKRLEGEKKTLDEAIATLQDEHTKVQKELGGIEEKLRQQSNLRANRDAEATKFENARVDATQALGVLAAQAPWVDGKELLDEADRLAGDQFQTLEDLKGKRHNATADLGEERTTFLRVIADFNQEASTDEVIAASGILQHPIDSPMAFAEVSGVITRVITLLGALKGSTLAKLETQINEAADRLREAFSLHFCNRLLDEIQRGERTVDKLNSELQHHKFGRDMFRFKGQWTSDAFRKRHSFLEHVREKSSDEGFNMFAENVLSVEHAMVRDEILTLFLNAADDGGKAALTQIADYREYRTYDLLKVMEVAGQQHEVSVTLQMTDSGGEKETGLFVARVATLTGGLGLREDGPHIRTVVVDELFKKTDEARIRSAVSYMTQLGLHVVFAMPTRAVGPFKDIIDTEYDVIRMKSEVLIGEIDHFVIVDRKDHNTKNIKKLKNEKRATVQAQATLEFEAAERATA